MKQGDKVLITWQSGRKQTGTLTGNNVENVMGVILDTPPGYRSTKPKDFQVPVMSYMMKVIGHEIKTR